MQKTARCGNGRRMDRLVRSLTVAIGLSLAVAGCGSSNSPNDAAPATDAGAADDGALTGDAALLPDAAGDAAQPGRFVVTPGEKTVQQLRYTATKLKDPDQRVLLAGGVVKDGAPTARAFLFDPATNTFNETGSMTTARADHTATLLNNGKILIAGGTMTQGTYNVELDSAEIYDPTTGTFTKTAHDMNMKRAGHGAAILANYDVLLAGDNNAQQGSNKAEIYHVATDTFEWTTHNMNDARAGMIMVPLFNGDVLIAGGYGGGGALKSAEVFDPSGGGTFTPTGMMSVARAIAAAVLLDNHKVIVVGGSDGLGTVLNTAELFDPAGNGGAGTFSLIDDTMAQPRMGAAVSLLSDGKAFISGGWSNPVARMNLNIAEIYDPAAVAAPYFQLIDSKMSVAMADHFSVYLGSGKTLLTAGDLNAEIYDEASAAFSVTGGMLAARGGNVATLLSSGKVYISGGIDRAKMPLGDAELFDPATGRSTTTDAMHDSRVGHSATSLGNGKLLIVGGGITGSAELYDPAAGEHVVIDGSRPTCNTAAHTATLLGNGKVLLAGGTDIDEGDNVANTTLYDPIANEFFNSSDGYLPPLSVGRVGHSATLMQDGRVLIAGGGNDEGETDFTAEIYDPTANTMRTLNAVLNQARAFHTATLLPDGKILIVSGEVAVHVGPHPGIYLVESCEMFDPAAETFTLIEAQMSEYRTQHYAVLLPDNRVLIGAGVAPAGTLASTEFFLGDRGIFADGPDMFVARWLPAIALLQDGRMIVTGAFDSTNYMQNSYELFEP